MYIYIYRERERYIYIYVYMACVIVCHVWQMPRWLAPHMTIGTLRGDSSLVKG